RYAQHYRRRIGWGNDYWNRRRVNNSGRIRLLVDHRRRLLIDDRRRLLDRIWHFRNGPRWRRHGGLQTDTRRLLKTCPSLRCTIRSCKRLRVRTSERLQSTVRRSHVSSVSSLPIDDDLLWDSVLYGRDLRETLRRQAQHKARGYRGPCESLHCHDN